MARPVDAARSSSSNAARWPDGDEGHLPLCAPLGLLGRIAEVVMLRRYMRALLDLSGPVNLASPHPVPIAEFLHTLRQAWGVPVGLPASGWMIEVGTFLMRTESELVLKSRRVVPTRLLEAGFEFIHPVWEEAARNLVRRWIVQRR